MRKKGEEEEEEEGDAVRILRAGVEEERGRILIREKETEATSFIKPAEEGKVSETRRKPRVQNETERFTQRLVIFITGRKRSHTVEEK